jgi:hypothetical protein
MPEDGFFEGLQPVSMTSAARMAAYPMGLMRDLSVGYGIRLFILYAPEAEVVVLCPLIEEYPVKGRGADTAFVVRAVVP